MPTRDRDVRSPFEPPRSRFAAIAFLVLAVGAHASADDAREVDESWKVIQLGSARIGYSHGTSRTVERDGRRVVLSRESSRITMKRFGQSITMQVDLSLSETPEGALLTATTVTRNPPAAASRTEATVDGDELLLKFDVGGRRTSRTIPWKPGTKSPNWSPTDAEGAPLAKGEKRTFASFLPDFNRITTTTVESLGDEEVELYDGTRRPLRKLVVTNDVVPGKTVVYVDEEGNELVTKVDLLGTEMVLHEVPRTVALERIEGAELDLGVNTLVRVKPIPNAHSTKRLVYRIHIDDDDPASYFPNGGVQSVRRIDDETIELTVRAASFPEDSADGEVGEEYLEASRYLQSDDEAVVAHAARAAGEETNPARVAEAMEAYVHDKLTSKNFSTAMASAAEVAERLEGDCTEHAVLLAAMLRARGIPSRIAVGLVYARSQSAFAGHMWTEAYVDGTWVPLDGTLGRGGTAGGHLKQADSSFSDDDGHPIAAFLPVLQSIGRLEIEVVDGK